MKESDLYVPVRDWLLSHGYEVHVEIFGCDIVAVKDELLTAVELKTGLTLALTNQLNRRTWWADFVIGAVPESERLTSYRKGRFGFFRHHGYGLLVVNGGRASQALKPRPQPWHWHKAHAYRVKRLTGRMPAQNFEIAGLPSCNALRSQRLLRDVGHSTPKDR